MPFDIDCWWPCRARKDQLEAALRKALDWIEQTLPYSQRLSETEGYAEYCFNNQRLNAVLDEGREALEPVNPAAE